MRTPRVVLDTNVLVAASRSKRGASAKLLSLLGTNRFEIVLTVPLVLEYEDAVLRRLDPGSAEYGLWDEILDYLCAVAKRQQVFFLWRPYLADPGDDMVLEAAVAGGCEAIITYNRRHFENLGEFALRVLEPREFLKELGALR